ncbi:PfkB family carbohydrate kinase [Mesorhizobium opportunistum]|uniref:PfkB family carbohydrate kinase n=1 Tax=Mesorhizobium opportunistum TaxID=593909 RepID=A0ABV1YR07_9HYPH|nr:PfkB family carbohydrate kinase [Mesorhizobium sp.]
MTLIEGNRSRFLALCGRADYLFLNMEEAEYLFEKKDVYAIADTAQAKCLCTFITNETEAYCISEGRVLKVNSPLVVVADAIGAGDTFAGAALGIQYLTGNPKAALSVGTYVASAQVCGSLSRFLYENIRDIEVH